MNFIYFLALISLGRPCCALITGAAVVPHGDFAFDPELLDNSIQKSKAYKVHKAAQYIAQRIASVQPDTIVISTPHGLADRKKFILYGNEKGFGSATLGQDLNSGNSTGKEYEVTQHLNLTLSKLDQLQFENISTLYAFGGGSQNIPLGWGEIIPLSIALSKMNQKTKVTILSHPMRRYNQSVSMIPELQLLGEQMGKHLDALKEKVFLLVSADLAHTHMKSGPYGFSPAAAPFDKLICEWPTSNLAKRRDFLSLASNYVDDAKSCGFTGIAWLNGILNYVQNRIQQSKLLACEHPTYYGMMIAWFEVGNKHIRGSIQFD